MVKYIAKPAMSPEELWMRRVLATLVEGTGGVEDGGEKSRVLRSRFGVMGREGAPCSAAASVMSVCIVLTSGGVSIR